MIHSTHVTNTKQTNISRKRLLLDWCSQPCAGPQRSHPLVDDAVTLYV